MAVKNFQEGFDLSQTDNQAEVFATTPAAKPDTNPGNSVRDRLYKKLTSVPQSKYFRERNVEKWLDLMQSDPRAEWHIDRLTGIGGSEIGVLVAGRRGVPDAFGRSPYSLVLEKMLVFMPKKQTLAMRKGVFLENGIRQFFLEDYNGTRDEEAMSAFDVAAKNRLRPWMRYSPDDVIVIGNQRFLVDYKHPGVASPHGDIHLGYAAQLHMGAMVAENAGININGMLLVQYPEAGSDNLVVTQVPFDQGMADDIIASGDEAWAHILNGTNFAPTFVTDALSLLPEEEDAISGLSAEFAKCKAMIKILTDRADGNADEIKKILAAKKVGVDTKLSMPGVDISVSAAKPNMGLLEGLLGDGSPKVPTYDIKAIMRHLKDSGADMSAFETGLYENDESAMLNLADKSGINLADVSVNSCRMLLKIDDGFKDDAGLVAKRSLEDLPTPAIPVKKTKQTNKPK